MTTPCYDPELWKETQWRGWDVVALFSSGRQITLPNQTIFATEVKPKLVT